MDRKEFIKTCGFACFGASAATVLLQSCVSSKNVTASISGENIIVPKSDFANKGEYLKYVIVTNEKLHYPIYVFRFSETDYSALLLQCTHQGNELNAFGEKLVCSAHGSEFNNRGQVTNGPAIRSLRSFPIQLESKNILISLKRV